MKRKKYILLACLFFMIFLSCNDNEKREEVVVDPTEAEAEAFEEDVTEMRSLGTDSLVLAVEGNPGLSTFATGLNAWNIGKSIDSLEGPFTVFAPSNEAYSTLYRDQGKEVLEVNNDAIISYHIVPEKWTAQRLKEEVNKNAKLPLQTLQGERLEVGMENGKLVLYGRTGNKATVTDSYASGGGMVYVIDRVLLPFEIETEVMLGEEENTEQQQ